MSSNEYSIIIAAPPDYEFLVAEIYYKGFYVGLITQDEEGGYKLEFPGKGFDEQVIARTVGLETFLEAVEFARNKLGTR